MSDSSEFDFRFDLEIEAGSSELRGEEFYETLQENVIDHPGKFLFLFATQSYKVIGSILIQPGLRVEIVDTIVPETAPTQGWASSSEPIVLGPFEAPVHLWLDQLFSGRPIATVVTATRPKSASRTVETQLVEARSLEQNLSKYELSFPFLPDRRF